MKGIADQYKVFYYGTFKIVNPEDLIPNFRDLIEDMIETIRELEEYNHSGGTIENPLGQIESLTVDRVY